MNINNIHQLTFNIEISLFHFTCAIHALTSNHLGKSKLVPKADLQKASECSVDEFYGFKKSKTRSGFVIDSYLKYSAFTGVKRDLDNLKVLFFFPGWLRHFKGLFIPVWREIHRSKILPVTSWQITNRTVSDISRGSRHSIFLSFFSRVNL